MNEVRRRGLQVLAVALFLGVVALQVKIGPMRDQIQGNNKFGENSNTHLMLELPNQMLGAVAIGFKEAIASVLWVRGDEFFHTGNYEAIIPIVRLVTWLDPHQLDVYSTGSWHLSYNFTDSESRSDRRYIPPAVALLKEGIKNNPNIYDLYFELGWTQYYSKIKDYKMAAYWMEKATHLPGKDPNTGKIGTRPTFVEHMLAHALEQTGDYDKAEKIWQKLINETEATLKKKPKDFDALGEIGICKKNLSTMLLRRGFRYGDMAAYKRGLDVGDSLEVADSTMKKALASVRSQYDRMVAQGTRPHDVSPAIDAQMKITSVRKKAPCVLEIHGELNLIQGKEYNNLAVNAYTAATGDFKRDWVNFARIYIRLADKGYQQADLNSFSLDVDQTLSIMQTDTQVHNGKFSIVVDMSKDRKQYPFVRQKYDLEVWFDPRLSSEDMQDRIGWLGEGITDKNYLDTTTAPGVNMLRYTKELDRSEIL